MIFSNRPPHLFLDNTYYFITSRTVDKIHFFDTYEKKNILVKIINKNLDRFQYFCYAWVILDNHYHLLILVNESKILSKFLKSIHGESAILLNKLDSQSSRKIWWNYWDRCIRNEKDFWKHFNYIHHNPIKHRYTQKMEDYRFSSYNHYLKKYGLDWMNICFRDYPIIDFTVKNDD